MGSESTEVKLTEGEVLAGTGSLALTRVKRKYVRKSNIPTPDNTPSPADPEPEPEPEPESEPMEIPLKDEPSQDPPAAVGSDEVSSTSNSKSMLVTLKSNLRSLYKTFISD